MDGESLLKSINTSSYLIKHSNSNLYLGNNSKQHYISKNEWDESQLLNELNENVLIKDLMETNHQQNSNIYSEIKSKSLKPLTTKILNSDLYSHRFFISNYHILNEILLDFDYNEYDDNFNQLLDIEMEFMIGCADINGKKFSMEYNMLMCELLNIKYVVENNKIKIPCVQFELLKRNFNKTHSRFTQCNGFPLSFIKYHAIEINIYTIKPTCQIIIKYKDVCDMNFFDKISHDYIFPIFGLNVQNNIQIINGFTENLNLSLITKFIIIKLKHIDHDLIDIHNINLYLNNCDPITYNIYMDEIKEITIFGNRYIILSVSPDFKNIIKLSDSLRNGDIGNHGIDFSRINHVNLEIKNISDNVKLDVCHAYMNIVKIIDGMCGRSFAD